MPKTMTSPMGKVLHHVATKQTTPIIDTAIKQIKVKKRVVT
jgi:hypothetical protein